MFTIPTDKVYKFTAIIAFFSIIFFAIVPDLFGYYSKREIVSIEIKRIELAEAIVNDSLALEKANILIASSNSAKVKIGKSIIDSVVVRSIERKPKAAALIGLADQQQELESAYKKWIYIRIPIITISLLLFLISICVWIRCDYQEYKKNA